MFRIGALVILQEEQSRKNRTARKHLIDASNPLELPETVSFMNTLK